MGNEAGNEAIAAPEPLVNADRVAEHFGVSRQWIYELVSEGRIPSYKVGSRRRFRISELEDFFRDNPTAAAS